MFAKENQKPSKQLLDLQQILQGKRDIFIVLFMGFNF
jgi:hypothetical protein